MTITLAVPAVPDGVTQVIEVSLPTVTLVAELPANVTPVAVAKPEPVIVTGVPPAVLPVAGASEETTGGAP